MEKFDYIASESVETTPSAIVNIERSPKFTGPLSGEMWAKVSKLGSNYPDAFDWSVYDSFFKKFGENQPRGGVVFKTTLKLANHHSSCSKCHYSFEIDTYGRGCMHNCTYCYAMEQLTSHGFWNRPHPFPTDLAELRKIFYTVFETSKPSKWRSILESRTPLRIGSMSDSFMWMDNKYGITRELLRILSFYNYPHIIFTRSDLIATDTYMNLLRKDLCSIQFSISGNDPELTKKLEPGAPSYAKRLNALNILNKNGFWTTVRINPFFPIFPDGYYTNEESIAKRFGSKEAAPAFKLFSLDMLKDLKRVGVPSILAGVVRLSPHAVRAMSKSTGINLKEFFIPDKKKGAYDLRYSDKEVAHYYRLISAEAKRLGLRFNTCYIGQGVKDYFAHQSLWDNKVDCCDARGNVPSFKKSCQEIPWVTRLKHSPNIVSAKAAQLEDESHIVEHSSGTLQANANTEQVVSP